VHLLYVQPLYPPELVSADKGLSGEMTTLMALVADRYHIVFFALSARRAIYYLVNLDSLRFPAFAGADLAKLVCPEVA